MSDAKGRAEVKVTEDMLDRAMKAMHRHGVYCHPDPVRHALEAVIADVSGRRDEYIHHAEQVTRRDARIAELEAEVARLREQASEVSRTIEEMSNAAERGDNDAPQRLLRSWARELRAALGEDP